MLNICYHDKFASDRLATTALELNGNVKLRRKRVGMECGDHGPSSSGVLLRMSIFALSPGALGDHVAYVLVRYRCCNKSIIKYNLRSDLAECRLDNSLHVQEPPMSGSS